ncbi:ABC transporter family protein [Bordetella holmesii 35009]|nr:ABC transporter family protein [Bordetella holmesii 35009]
MGLVSRRHADMRFMGRDISTMRPFEVARLGLGYVPEERRIFTDLSVAENLDMGRQPARRWPDGSAAANWQPQDMYRLFPNLATLRDRPAGLMSGGEQQMLAVARTLMGNPYLIMMDEPSEGVAPSLSSRWRK